MESENNVPFPGLKPIVVAMALLFNFAGLVYWASWWAEKYISQ
jgi:hypothetical protein